MNLNNRQTTYSREMYFTIQRLALYYLHIKKLNKVILNVSHVMVRVRWCRGQPAAGSLVRDGMDQLPLLLLML